jgi:nitrate reductase delta subunit
LINEAGFDRLDGELADYIPMLYEFLAVAQENPAVERLKRRLAAATFRISENIEEKNPYALVFKRLMMDVFLAPSVEELENLKKERETADLEELPYPLMYDA